jgi:DNA-binding GntR family transcriptional regulator
MAVEDGDLQMIPAAQRASTVEHATTEIRRAILDGRMAPGTEASIAVLGEQLGISSIPIREALRALEAEGLIVLRPNRRAEVELAARSTSRYPEETLRRLEELVDSVASESVWSAKVDLHNELHEVLVQPAASDFDWRLLRTIWRAGDRYVRFNIRGFSESDLKASHMPLLEAARGKSEVGMRKALTAHLQEGLEVLGRALNDAAAGR